ncbi:MAG: hypothetical protein M3Q69_12430 [Acidobacteriota bacterium]|nr:hypothetical protein [Acidobacteriota bacterium]
MLVAAGLAAASLLAFLLSGSGPWPIDRGVGFTYETSDRRDGVRLTKTEGDMTCYLRIKMPPEASVSSVHLDKSALRARRDDEWWRIEDPATRLGRFNWYAGGSVRLAGTHLEIQDWELFRASGRTDSKSRTALRLWWSVASVALLAMSVVGVIVQALTPPEGGTPFRVTADNCAFASVEWLNARHESDTKRMREVLAEWLILKDTPPGVTYRDLILLREGKKQLRVFLDSLARELTRLVEKLTP